MSQLYQVNQFAPDYLAGMNGPGEGEVGFTDYEYAYTYEPSGGSLGANENPLNELIQIDQDADFYLTAWHLSRVGAPFLISMSDSTGYDLTDGFISSSSISYDGSRPSPLSPAHPFPAGSLIKLQLREITGSPVPLQIVFRGYRRRAPAVIRENRREWEQTQ